MATRGRPGGGGANDIKSGMVGSFEKRKGGSWRATIRGGCGTVVKLLKSERKTSQLPRQLCRTIGKDEKTALLSVYLVKKLSITGQSPKRNWNRRRDLQTLLG